MREEILKFLGCETPHAWIEAARENINLLLIDHAHNEKKAASTAICLISHYPRETSMLNILSRLAREEMGHFESVLKILKEQNITLCHLAPGRYAKSLHKYKRPAARERLIDSLLIAAIIEARSCERFFVLQSILPDNIRSFYRKLCKAEARHFQIYLKLAQEIGMESFFSQLELLRSVENNLILEKDIEFRFHSGTPH